MFWLCRTCGVEHGTASSVCAICADDRQWVPAEGQQWATLEQLVAEGMRSQVSVIEDGLVAIGISFAAVGCETNTGTGALRCCLSLRRVVQALDQAARGCAQVVVAAHFVQHSLQMIDALEHRIHQFGVDRQLAVAQSIEHIFGDVAERHHRIQRKKSGAALQRRFTRYRAGRRARADVRAHCAGQSAPVRGGRARRRAPGG